jgi:hypothetical protein
MHQNVVNEREAPAREVSKKPIQELAEGTPLAPPRIFTAENARPERVILVIYARFSR